MFAETTSIERVDDNLYEGIVDKRWWVVRGPHGGYLSAIALRALMETLDDPDRPVRSFTTHFTAAPKEGPIRIATKIERAGRNMTFITARTTQDDQPVMLSLAAFSGPWEGFEFDDAPVPDVPCPDEAFPVPIEGENIPAFLGNFDMRWAIGDPPFSGSSEAVLGGWMRLREPEVVDAPLMATFLDAWAPVVFPRSKDPIVAPTIDLTMHFRSALPIERAQSEDFYLGRFSSVLGRDGFFEEDGTIWGPDGKLLAQSRQLALALPLRR